MFTIGSVRSVQGTVLLVAVAMCLTGCPRNQPVAPAPPAKAPDKTAGDSAPPKTAAATPKDPHLALFLECEDTTTKVADALAAARDAASVDRATKVLEEQAVRLNGVVARLRQLGPPSDAELKRIVEATPNSEKENDRLVRETNAIQARLPSMRVPQTKVQALDTSLKPYSDAMAAFVKAAQPK